MFRRRAFGNGFKQLFDRREKTLGLDVSDHNQGCIVGRIEGVVVPLQIVKGHSVEVGEPADDRPVIWMTKKGLSKQSLHEGALGIVLRSQASFFFHYLTLGLEFGLIENQPLHPICFKLQGEFDTVGCDILKIRGKVLAGECVVDSSVFSDESGERTFGVPRRALEHHVFEHM